MRFAIVIILGALTMTTLDTILGLDSSLSTWVSRVAHMVWGAIIAVEASRSARLNRSSRSNSGHVVGSTAHREPTAPQPHGGGGGHYH